MESPCLGVSLQIHLSHASAATAAAHGRESVERIAELRMTKMTRMRWHVMKSEWISHHFTGWEMTHQDSSTLSEETLVVISFIVWKLKNKSAKVFEKHSQNRVYHEKLLFSLTFHNPPTHPIIPRHQLVHSLWWCTRVRLGSRRCCWYRDLLLPTLQTNPTNKRMRHIHWVLPKAL